LNKQLVIPDLCKNSSVFIVVLVTQVFALIFALVRFDEQMFVVNLAYISLYCQWVVLLACALLCVFRKVINHAKRARKLFLLFVCLFIPLFTIETVIAIFIRNPIPGILGRGDEYWIFMFVRLLIALICAFLVSRYFVLLELLSQRNKAEMNQRLLALQARIKPHFLFNSLNTISELAASRSEHAEHAINSLAMLFRATLETESKRHTLESELNLCRRYESLERWRLSDRLSVEWQVNIKDPAKWVVPKLILQPLLENGITHGVEADGSVNIEIDVRETSSHLSLRISNGIDDLNAGVAGNGIALENIRERLFVMYDDQQTLKVNQSTDTYSIIMRLPKQTRMAAENRA